MDFEKFGWRKMDNLYYKVAGSKLFTITSADFLGELPTDSDTHVHLEMTLAIPEDADLLLEKTLPVSELEEFVLKRK